MSCIVWWFSVTCKRSGCSFIHPLDGSLPHLHLPLSLRRHPAGKLHQCRPTGRWNVPSLCRPYVLGGAIVFPSLSRSVTSWEFPPAGDAGMRDVIMPRWAWLCRTPPCLKGAWISQSAVSLHLIKGDGRCNSDWLASDTAWYLTTNAHTALSVCRLLTWCQHHLRHHSWR